MCLGKRLFKTSSQKFETITERVCDHLRKSKRYINWKITLAINGEIQEIILYVQTGINIYNIGKKFQNTVPLTIYRITPDRSFFPQIFWNIFDLNMYSVQLFIHKHFGNN